MNKNVVRYIALFALSMGAAASYTLPYIKYIFYDAWVAGLGGLWAIVAALPRR